MLSVQWWNVKGNGKIHYNVWSFHLNFDTTIRTSGLCTLHSANWWKWKYEKFFILVQVNEDESIHDTINVKTANMNYTKHCIFLCSTLGVKTENESDPASVPKIMSIWVCIGPKNTVCSERMRDRSRFSSSNYSETKKQKFFATFSWMGPGTMNLSLSVTLANIHHWQPVYQCRMLDIG